jgi:hypothetical protein
MYRLLHHTDKFPNVDVLVKNSEKQLVKPLIRLFQGTESLKEISTALGELIAQRRGVKKDTIEYAVYKTVEKLIEERKVYSFTAKLVYTSLKEELDGTYKDEEKDQSFDTAAHGKVSHKKINSICEDRFGAKKERTRDGYMLTFNEERFKKVKEAYSLEDKGVQIISNNLGESVKVVQVSGSSGASSETFSTTPDDENRAKTEENEEEIEEEDKESEEFEDEGEPENV